MAIRSPSSSTRKASAGSDSTGSTTLPSYRESLKAFPYDPQSPKDFTSSTSSVQPLVPRKNRSYSEVSEPFFNPRPPPPIPTKSPARSCSTPNCYRSVRSFSRPRRPSCLSSPSYDRSHRSRDNQHELETTAGQDPTRDLEDLERCIHRIEAHHSVALKASDLYHSTNRNRSRRRPLPKPSKRICLLLLLNISCVTIIAIAGYLGTTASGRKTAQSSTFWCNFTNALPKSLISAAFVFVIAVFGLTPYAQRMLSGRFWTQLLYVFWLFMLGGIIGALNHGIRVDVVRCRA